MPSAAGMHYGDGRPEGVTDGGLRGTGICVSDDSPAPLCGPGGVSRNRKREVIPPERHDTVRHEIMRVLDGHTCSALEISAEVRVSEKEVFGHLEHIRRTLGEQNRKLVVTPAECLGCGFVFRKRDRLTAPGRCPVCHGEHIQEPLYSIDGVSGMA